MRANVVFLEFTVTPLIKEGVHRVDAKKGCDYLTHIRHSGQSGTYGLVTLWPRYTAFV